MSSESRCINHPHREATGRCKRCNVPLCTECKIIVAEGTFCSERCLTQMRIFLKRAKELDKDVKKPPARFPARRVIMFILVVGAIVLVLRFKFGVSSFADVQNLFLSIVNTIRRG